jgi:hypothetical protein
MGRDIPASFFSDLEGVLPVNGWKPAGAMKWYDSIIDDLLANPGTSLKDCARRLGRSPSTISSVASSDLFKARWAQRRQQFEEALRDRMVNKLTQAAELSLDLTIEQMGKKRDAIPLPVLTEITKSTLDRLGYGPQQDRAAVQVNVSSNVVSAEALASAREKLKLVEGRVLSDPVAGPDPTEGEED